MSKKIKTAILSYGMSGEVFHLPLLEAQPGFEVVVIGQRNRSKPVRHQYQVAYSPADIFTNPDVELVIVNTPNDSHFEYASQAIRAGKHVVVEKPFTVTTKESDELIELAKKAGVVLTVFQNRRWDADFLTVRKVLKEELVGKLVECEIHYDRFRNYIEADTWKEESAPGTGILYNLGSHLIDQALVLFGMPRYVDARIGIQRPGGRVDDFFDIRMTYDGLNVILKSSYLVREQGPRFQLHGTLGSFVKSGLDPQEQALKDKQIPGSKAWGEEPKDKWGKINSTIQGRDVEGPYESMPGNYLAFYDNLFDVIRKGDSLAVKAEEARNVIRLIEACIISSDQRKAVKI